MTLPSLSVIIPVYNGGINFHRCLASLAESELLPQELIVVADGDTDGSWLVAKNFGATVIRVPHSQGPAHARNLGAKAAKGDILFFMDADVEIYPDTLTKVVKFFEQDKDLIATIGSYDDKPGASNFLSQYKNLFHHYTHQNSSTEASTFWGACGAIRREVFQAVGGFDNNYRTPCIEDIELGYRLKRLGHKLTLNKDLQVKHLKHWGFVSLLRAEFFYRALPWSDLIIRDRHMLNDLNLQWSSRLSVVLVYAFLLTLIVSSLWQPCLILTSLIATALLIINAPVYEFFSDKRGFLFTMQVIPWHWLYYFYSGLAFGISLVNYHSRSYSRKIAWKLRNLSRRITVKLEYQNR